MAEEDRRKIIEKIRHRRGADLDLEQLRREDPDHPIVALRETLERGTTRLSEELYTKKSRFLPEFIQNADDNTYPPNTVPTLIITLADKVVVVKCNEAGFAEENVVALCDIGKSTKSDKTHGYIGEKGIGFKSVFSVADRVYIASNGFVFMFDKNKDLGMLTPVLENKYGGEDRWTIFHLEAPDRGLDSEVWDDVREIDSTLLLFLRKLRTLSIASPERPDAALTLSRTDNGNITSIRRVTSDKDTLEHFVVFKDSIDAFREEKKREGITETEIVLAFPVKVTEGRKPEIKPRNVHAFLPLRRYGFHFVIQADFLTSSSREDVLVGNDWNNRLLTGITTTFFSAVKDFMLDPSLRFTWLAYLPDRVHETFSTVEDEIFRQLKKMPILLDSSGNRQRPSDVLILPSEYMDAREEPLVPEDRLPSGKKYLHREYDLDHILTPRLQERLGLLRMSKDDFNDGLKNMGYLMRLQDDAWHELVCLQINNVGHYGFYYEYLPILPLNNETWQLGCRARDCVFGLEGSEIPDGLGLKPLKHDIGPQRRILFENIGVSKADPPNIARRILQSTNTVGNEILLKHALFLFENRWAVLSLGLDCKKLRLVDERGQVGHGPEIYLNEPDLREVVSSGRFIHLMYREKFSDSEFTQKQFTDWLQGTVGVNTIPRVVSGSLSDEFINFGGRISTSRFLSALKQYWFHLEDKLDEAGIKRLSEVKVTCVDGIERPLSSTYLRRSRFDDFPLPNSLPIEDPESYAWDFLEALNVSITLDSAYLLKCLDNMAGQVDADVDMKYLIKVYEQLDGRFYTDETVIRDAFQNKPVLYVPPKPGVVDARGTWLSYSQVYWDGPRSVTSAVYLRHYYSDSYARSAREHGSARNIKLSNMFQTLTDAPVELEGFFSTRLKIPNAPPEALVAEIKSFVGKYESGILDDAAHKNLSEMMRDLHRIMNENDAVPPSVRELHNVAMFPYRNNRLELRLGKISDIFVPDNSSTLANAFRGKVNLLEAHADFPMAMITVLLKKGSWNARFADKEVKHAYLPNIFKRMDTDNTDTFALRKPYIRGLLIKKGRSETHIAKVLAKEVEIYKVDTITSMATLDNISVLTPLNGRTDGGSVGKVLIYITEGCSPRTTASFIGKHFGLDWKDVHFVMTMGVDDLNAMFKEDGVLLPAELARMDGLTGHKNELWDFPNAKKNYTGPMQPRNARKNKIMIPAQKPLLLSSDSRTFPVLSRSAEMTQVTLSTNVPQASANIRRPDFSALVRTHDTVSPTNPMSPTRHRKNEFSPPSTLRLDDVDAHLTKLTSQPRREKFSQYRSSITRKYHEGIGILGESHVYEYFSKKLPPGDFVAETHWTSILRSKLPGATLSNYTGNDYADFTYADTTGSVTEILIKEKHEDWRSNWPTYHFVVKATEGGLEEPCHFSDEEFETARVMTISADLPKHIFVIIRVFSVESQNPGLEFFVDPHRCIFEGILKIASEAKIAATST